MVELALTVERTCHTPAALVRFVTIQMRERGKNPNYVIGGMDIAAAGLSVDSLLDPECPVLPRLLRWDAPARFVRGPGGDARSPASRALAVPARGVPRWVLRDALRAEAPDGCHLLEIGGGCGGDAPLWVGLPSEMLRSVDVIDPDSSPGAGRRPRR